jgi:hypothetical protein
MLASAANFAAPPISSRTVMGPANNASTVAAERPKESRNCETKQSLLIRTGGVLQLVVEEDVQDRVNHVPGGFFGNLIRQILLWLKAVWAGAALS